MSPFHRARAVRRPLVVRREPTVLSLLTDLVRLRTVADGEEAAAVRCATVLDDAGLQTTGVAWEPNRFQLVARAGGDAPLTFTGHLDTVPATPPTGASTPGPPPGTATGWSAAARAT